MKNVFDSPVGFQQAGGAQQFQQAGNVPRRGNMQSAASLEQDLEKKSVQELLLLRARIDELLPAKSLKDLNLQEEAVIQFLVVKALQESVMSDETVPANQKAQVANSCASTLQQLDKVQKESYTFERFKEIEHILAETMNDWPIEMSQAFFESYERRLGVAQSESTLRQPEEIAPDSDISEP